MTTQFWGDWRGLDTTAPVRTTDEERTAWDTLILGGSRMPGLAFVTNSTVEVNFAEVSTQAEFDKETGEVRASFPARTPTKRDLWRFTVELRMWTAEQLDAWYSFLKGYGYAGAPRELTHSFKVVHPEINGCGVNEVTIDSISVSPPDDARSFHVVELSLTQKSIHDIIIDPLTVIKSASEAVQAYSDSEKKRSQPTKAPRKPATPPIPNGQPIPAAGSVK